MIQIAPSILSCNFAELSQELATLGDACDALHVDVMDGQFVPQITIGQPVVKALRKVTDLPLDVHLMIRDPDNHIESFAEAGADTITVHVEACAHLQRTLKRIRDLGVRAGVALNPATPLETIRWVLEDLDLVLLMTVNPGFGGQSLIPASFSKLRELSAWLAAEGCPAAIEVDGGVSSSNAATLADAGAQILVAGTAIFGASDRMGAIAELRRATAQR